MCKINICLENNINIKGNISVNFEQFCSDIIKERFADVGGVVINREKIICIELLETQKKRKVKNNE